MREHYSRVPRAPAGWCPEHAADERAVVGDDADGFARDLDAGVVFGQWPVAEPQRASFTSERVGHEG